MPNMITGLDIGSAYIKGIVATFKKDGTLSVISAFKHPSAGFRRGVLVNQEDALKVIRELIIDLEKLSKKAVDNIFVNLNSEYVRPRLSRGMVAVSRADQEIQQDHRRETDQHREDAPFGQHHRAEEDGVARERRLQRPRRLLGVRPAARTGGDQSEGPRLSRHRSPGRLRP